MLHQTGTWICWSPARDPEPWHQCQGKFFAEERITKAWPGSQNYCLTANSGKPWCQGNTTKGRIPIGFGLGYTATPCLCFPICRIPLFIGFVWASQLMLTRGNEPGIMVTQVHHKDSAFRRKKCFLLTAWPTNSLTEDLFVGQEFANMPDLSHDYTGHWCS